MIFPEIKALRWCVLSNQIGPGCVSSSGASPLTHWHRMLAQVTGTSEMRVLPHWAILGRGMPRVLRINVDTDHGIQWNAECSTFLQVHYISFLYNVKVSKVQAHIWFCGTSKQSCGPFRWLKHEGLDPIPTCSVYGLFTYKTVWFSSGRCWDS